MTDFSAWAILARLIRPQGRRGELVAEILTDFADRFNPMQKVFIAQPENAPPLPFVIEQSWLHKGRVVLKFTGIDSISAAESLRGANVVVPADERMALNGGAVYIDDLAGCLVIDRNRPGNPSIGTVRDVIRQENTVDLLVVAGPDGTEHWIPFARAYLVEMDLPGRRLEMKLPAGLLEVNAPPTEEELQSQRNETSHSEE